MLLDKMRLGKSYRQIFDDTFDFLFGNLVTFFESKRVVVGLRYFSDQVFLAET